MNFMHFAFFVQKYFMSGSKYKSSPGKQGKSHLVIEWTNQHGCGHGDLDCNIVLQYMCQGNRYESLDTSQDLDTIRNGKSNLTIMNLKAPMSASKI